MAIPDFQSAMLPLLQFLGSGEERHTSRIRHELAQRFHLTAEQLAEMLPSGTQRLFVNRVAWALVYLKRAGLVASATRAHYQITQSGLRVLDTSPERIDIKFLQQFEEFTDGGRAGAHPVVDATEADTPQERIDRAYTELRGALDAEILDLVKSCSPTFFERLVVELLVAMGYGGSVQDAGEAIGRSGDEGIDGIIKEDRLGLDTIYLQAKRWTGSVGRPEIQKFAGALQGKKARKGVFLTTSSYTTEAIEFVANLEVRIVLIDGSELAHLMVEHGIGVTTETTYRICRVDQDYFSDD